MKIKTMLIAGFIAVAVLTGVTGFFGWYGATKIKADADQAMYLADTRNMLKDRENDHYRWAMAIDELFLDNKKTLDVEMDHTQCALGKFLYGGELDNLRDRLPDVAAGIDAIKTPHEHLHSSARTIADNWAQVHEGLAATLMRRLDDHRNWMLNVSNALLENQPITVETNPAQCEFGQWMAGQGARSLMNEWPEFASMINDIKPHHNKLHQSVIDINNAETLEEKFRIFNQDTTPAMAAVADTFLQLIAMENERVAAQKTAMAVFKGETLPAMHDVQAGIKSVADLTETLELKIEKDQDSRFSRQKVLTLVVMFTAILLALALGLGISRYIIAAIQNVMEFTGKLSKGDVSARLDMGKTGDGRARTNELQEMAAGLNTLADELAAKAGVATAIGNGDLDHEVHVASDKDVLGHALQNMTTGLNQIIAEIYQAAEQVNTSAGHIADSSQSLSQGATEQAASVEEISSSMVEIGTQSSTNADNAGQASKLAMNARDSGATSIERMNEMTASMQAIDASSKEIQKIIKVIDDIAFQTNLLALNAAVEAARAGKHGKGFAVVAQEVRSLAARSAKAAKETEGLIEDALNRVNGGNEIAENVATALTEMNEQVVKISDILQEISAASNEQAQGISQINDGIDQVDAVTQQNTANAEETAASAEELSGQAAHVRNTLARFKLKKAGQVQAITAGAEHPGPTPVIGDIAE